jgi:iron complex transport system substrate-binding protein
MALAAWGCERRPPPAGRGILMDEAGRRVMPRALPAERIVSLAPNVTELLSALGAVPRIVGVDNYSDEPVGVLDGIPRVGSDYEPSLERIVALSPDIVLTSLSANRRETVEALERLGVPVFVTDTRSLPDLERLLRTLGTITGRERQSDLEIRRLRVGLDGVRRRSASGPRPRVLVVVWADPLYVAGRGTFTHDLIEIAGGTNIASDVVGFVRYPLERVLRSAPEVLVLPTHSSAEQGPGAVGTWSRWPQIPAVRRGRVHAVEDTIIIRAGPRLVEGAELLLRLIHPDAGPGAGAK